jgi:hypothetical protein
MVEVQRGAIVGRRVSRLKKGNVGSHGDGFSVGREHGNVTTRMVLSSRPGTSKELHRPSAEPRRDFAAALPVFVRVLVCL